MMRKAMIAVGIVAPLVLVTQANGQTTNTRCTRFDPYSVNCTSTTSPNVQEYLDAISARERALAPRTSPWGAAVESLGESLSKIPHALAKDADRKRRIAEHEAYMEYMRAQTEALRRQNGELTLVDWCLENGAVLVDGAGRPIPYDDKWPLTLIFVDVATCQQVLGSLSMQQRRAFEDSLPRMTRAQIEARWGAF